MKLVGSSAICKGTDTEPVFRVELNDGKWLKAKILSIKGDNMCNNIIDFF